MTRRRESVLAVAAVLLLLGCSGSSGNAEEDTVPRVADTVETVSVDDSRTPESDSPPIGPACSFPPPKETEGSATKALFSFGDPPLLPIPFDLFTLPDLASPTGRTVNLTASNSVLLDQGLGFITSVDGMLDLVNGLDGFGRYAPVVTAFSGPLDETQLDLEPEEYASFESPVFLVPLESDGGCVAPVPTFVAGEETDGPEGPLTLLIVTPFVPLRPATRYALVVTREFRDAAGQSVVPDDHFLHAVGCGGSKPAAQDDRPDRAADLLRPLELCLQGLPEPLCLCDLAVATIFSTRDSSYALRTIRDFLESPAAPPLNLSLDIDGDGGPDTYAALEAPNWPAAVTPENLGKTSVVLRGAFDAPDFRNENMDLRVEFGEPPAISSTFRIPFVLLLPADAQQQPFKLVVMGHGHNATKERTGYLARDFAEQGLALAAIDAVGHGELEGSGEFMVPTDIPQVRGSFLQSEANLLRFIQALHELEELDIFPPDAPDGNPDLELSAGMGYVGESLGGIIGSIGCSLAPEMKAVVLNCSGGGFLNFGDDVISNFIPPDERLLWWGLAVLAMTAMDHLDPVSYTGLLSGVEDPALPTRSLLMQAVIGDNAFDGAPTAVTARALGLDYVCPCPQEVPYLDKVSAPVIGNGLYYYDNAAHGFLLDEMSNPAATDAGRQQAAHFLRTALSTGQGEVVHLLP